MGVLGEKLYLCLQDKIMEVSANGSRYTPAAGASSLCAEKNALFYADDAGAIWRFDRENMVECAIGSGGPGACDMCLSEDGSRLFSLLGDADSILMSDAYSLKPLAVNRCGCNPRNISRCGSLLAVSGGKSECVHLFDASTLECMAKIPMPGPVCSVFLLKDTICALCLTEELDSLFVIRRDEGNRCFRFQGMPGCLCACRRRIWIATRGCIYEFALDSERLIGMRSAPGRASGVCFGWGNIFLLDALSECVFAAENGLPWRCLLSGAKGMFACHESVQ